MIQNSMTQCTVTGAATVQSLNGKRKKRTSDDVGFIAKQNINSDYMNSSLIEYNGWQQAAARRNRAEKQMAIKTAHIYKNAKVIDYTVQSKFKTAKIKLLEI